MYMEIEGMVGTRIAFLQHNRKRTSALSDKDTFNTPPISLQIWQC